MTDSAWIVPLLVKQLSVKDNIIYEGHQRLKECFQADRDCIILLSPDGDIDTAIRCDGDNAVEISTRGMVVPDCVRMPGGDDIIYQTGEGTAVLLKTDKTKTFGYVLFPELKCPVLPGDPDAVSAAKSLSSIIYYEAIGSIIKSVHEPVLRVRDLEKTYNNNSRIVKGISFDICKDEFTVLLGSSGCGKSTTVNVIGGMLKATGGHVYYGDRDITMMNEHELSDYRRNTVGFVFQHYNLIDNLTAGENIELASSLVRDSLSVDEALSLVGLEHKKNSYPGEMSGGEKQRVSIARALAKRSKLLICDEPTGALDSVNANHVIALLQNIAKNEGVSVITITHNPEYSVLADHYLYMKDGLITKDYLQPFPLQAAQLADNIQGSDEF